MDAATPIRRPPSQALIAALRQRFGDRLSTAAAVREHHGKDASYHPAAPPDAVVFARSTEEVAETVRLCAAERVPVIPFGTGTSLEGHVAALEGGVSIDLSQMNRMCSASRSRISTAPSRPA